MESMAGAAWKSAREVVSHGFTLPGSVGNLENWIKRCQLSQLGVFLETSNYLKMIFVQFSIAAFFACLESFAWNYLTYSIRFLPQTSLRNRPSASYTVSAKFMDWFFIDLGFVFPGLTIFLRRVLAVLMSLGPPCGLERSWNPWKCRSTPVGIWSPPRCNEPFL